MTSRTADVGTKYGHWLVVEPSGTDRSGNARYLCRCDCGTERPVLGFSLVRGDSKSCGCKRAQIWRENTKPWRNRRRSKLKSVHNQMIYRCHKEGHPYYEWYGARGIKVCDRWHDFLNFYLDMGYPEPGQTIERIDNARGYEPGNCCWVTMKEQARNKRGLHVIEHAGKRWCATDLAHEHGMHPQTLMARMKRGMSASEALAKPVKSAGRRAYVSTRQQARVP